MAKIKVTVEKIEGHCNQSVLVGDFFYVEDSKLSIPDGKQICIWALQSMMPIFPVLDVSEHLPDDNWMKNVKHFICPDPDGRVIYRLEIVE